MRFAASLLRLALRRPRVAAEALYWHITGKRLRARNMVRLGHAQSSAAYREWIRQREALPRALEQARADLATWSAMPLLSVILHHGAEESTAAFERRLAALTAQIYPAWELVLVPSRASLPSRGPDAPRVTLVSTRTDHPTKALSLGLAAATGDYVLPLGDDVLLAPDALYRFARAIRSNPESAVLYGDEDRLVPRLGFGTKRVKPWFKPLWNAELFLAQDYLSRACVLRRAAALAVPPAHPALGEAGLYALLLAMTRDNGAVHVPHVVAHRTGSVTPDADGHLAAVAQHIAPQGGAAREGPFGNRLVDWPLPDPAPLVSIIIPTRDHVGLLRKSVGGVLTGTRYRHVEVLIVDNGSVEPETLAYLERVSGNPRVTVIRDDAPFNYSALNNRAAAQASGDYLLLLNNDVEVVDEDWLGWLVRQAVREGVGAVGAKLLYDDRSIQHAGVTIGLGDAAGHAHRFLKEGEEGYFARAHLPHQVSAVTGACLLVERAKFEAVGGLDEEGFAVAFNDVDLCLKLQAAGWRNMYEPRAVMIHHESKSRPKDHRPDQLTRWRRELDLLQSRWSTAGYVDPAHHREMERRQETYLIGLG